MGRRGRTEKLDALSPGEQASVLTALLARHPDLGDEAEELATDLLTGVDRDEVADHVVDVYLDQSYMDIAPRVGRQPHRGYVHETEAQWELLEEAIEPFMDEIERLAGLGMHDEAAEHAAGIVDGLARLRDVAGEQTLIGWGRLEDDTAALAEGVRITCEKLSVEPVPGLDPR